LKFSVASKFVIDKNITVTGSFEVDFKKGSKAIDFKNYYFTPYGY